MVFFKAFHDQMVSFIEDKMELLDTQMEKDIAAAIEASTNDTVNEPASNVVAEYMNIQNVNNVITDAKGDPLQADQVTDRLAAFLADTTIEYPKVFVKGMSAHGYGGDHAGKTRGAILTYATNVISESSYSGVSRQYAASSVNPEMTKLYAIGSNTANENPSVSKIDLSTETGTVFTGPSQTGILGAATSSKTGKNMYWCPNYVSTIDTSTDTSIAGYGNLPSSSVHKGPTPIESRKTQSAIIGSNDQLVQFKLNTLTKIAVGFKIRFSYSDYDNSSLAFGNKSIVLGGGNSSKAQFLFNFYTDIGTTIAANIYHTGESKMANGNGSVNQVGGFQGGGSSQNNVCVNINETTYVSKTNGTTVRKMSSAVHAGY